MSQCDPRPFRLPHAGASALCAAAVALMAGHANGQPIPADSTGWISVTDYEANPAANNEPDTTAIQAAANAARDSANTLFFPRGTYEIDGTVTFENIRVRGTQIASTTPDDPGADGIPGTSDDIHFGTEIVYTGVGGTAFSLQGTRCVIDDLHLATSDSDVVWFEVPEDFETFPPPPPPVYGVDHVDIESVTCLGGGTFLRTVSRDTDLVLWNCDATTADAALDLRGITGAVNVTDSRFRASAQATDWVGIQCDVSGFPVESVNLSGVVIGDPTEDLAVGPTNTGISVAVVGSSPDVARVNVVGCSIRADLGVSVVVPAVAELQVLGSHIESSDAALLVLDDDLEAPPEFTAPAPILMRGNSIIHPADALLPAIFAQGYDGHISITANHFALEGDPAARTVPLVEIIGVDQGAVNISANIFPEINADEDLAPAIRLVDCDGAVISANAIPGDTQDQYAVDLLAGGDHVATTGNLLAGRGIGYPSPIDGAGLNVLGDETNNLILGPAESSPPLFIANANSGQGNVLIVNGTNEFTLNTPMGTLDLESGARPTDLVTAQREGDPSGYLFVADERTAPNDVGFLTVYRRDVDGLIQSYQKVDEDPVAPGRQSFVLQSPIGQETFIHPRGVAVVDNPNANGHRLYIACQGNLYSAFDQFRDNYDSDADTRGVIEIHFDPSIPPPSSPFVFGRWFQVPVPPAGSSASSAWPFDLIVPYDVDVTPDGSTLVVCTGTPPEGVEESGTFLAQILAYDLSSPDAYPVGATSTTTARIPYQGDEMTRIAFSESDPTDVWTVGLQTSTAILTDLSDPSDRMIRSFRYSGEPSQLSDLALVEELIDSTPTEVAYYTFETKSPGPGIPLPNEYPFGVAGLTRAEPAAGPAMLTMGTETWYGLAGQVSTDALDPLQLERSHRLNGPAGGLTVLSRSPITGGSGLVVTVPSENEMVFIQVEEPVSSPDRLRTMKVEGLSEPMAVAAF